VQASLERVQNRVFAKIALDELDPGGDDAPASRQDVERDYAAGVSCSRTICDQPPSRTKIDRPCAGLGQKGVTLRAISCSLGTARRASALRCLRAAQA
jgi:hypothetical protein